MIVITSAYRTTSGVALNIELYLLSIDERLDIELTAALLRIKSGLNSYISTPRIP